MCPSQGTGAGVRSRVDVVRSDGLSAVRSCTSRSGLDGGGDAGVEAFEGVACGVASAGLDRFLDLGDGDEGASAGGVGEEVMASDGLSAVAGSSRGGFADVPCGEGVHCGERIGTGVASSGLDGFLHFAVHDVADVGHGFPRGSTVIDTFAPELGP